MWSATQINKRHVCLSGGLSPPTTRGDVDAAVQVLLVWLPILLVEDWGNVKGLLNMRELLSDRVTMAELAAESRQEHRASVPSQRAVQQ